LLPIVISLALALSLSATSAADLPLGAASVLHEDQAGMKLAADLLRRDLQAVSGQPSAEAARLEDCAQTCIVIGRYDSPLIRGIAQAEGVSLSLLDGQWERYERVVIPSRSHPGVRIMLIAGSDTRGAIYGVIDLTRELGVSAWEWWADVKPQRREQVAVSAERILSEAPFVQYRGVFLNDEDWGLQPWAAKNFDPSGDIGPATYARIFELLWRLKANLIWPAMHDSTKPFYQMAGNARTASDYAIVVGTSHAEPMMRNNVREWDHKTRGAFNFFTNREALLSYWAGRVDEVKGYENMYSTGIRGVHDSAMEGAHNIDEAREGVTAAIAAQRALLSRALGKPAPQIPQALTLYKEVLDIYKASLQVPDDITLVWPDDNYGYLHQLSTDQEARRSGGAGLYYHLSYWGRPHDYLWLGSTHPALVREQMERAAATGARKVWVVNVGDIKPAEYLTQYFLDLAFDRRQLERSPRAHLEEWMAAQFGPAHAREIAAVMTDWYDLAWERRPEFMGFGLAEPVTATRQTDYLLSGGEEAEQRLERYQSLVLRAQALAATLPAGLKDAYFQLVLYPVRASANLNTRILKLDLAAQYARQGRPSADLYARQAQAAQAAIITDTAQYNAQGDGKWHGIMDATPRRLPVFSAPLFPSYGRPTRQECALAYPAPLSSLSGKLAFTNGRAGTRTITLVNYGAQTQAWSTTSVPAAFKLSREAGELNAGNGFEQRIQVRYDGSDISGTLALQCGGTALNAAIRIDEGAAGEVATEQEKIITMPATTGVASGGWAAVPGLGSLGGSMRAGLALPSIPASSAAHGATLDFAFVSHLADRAQLKLVAAPVHALTSANQLRIAVSVDDGPLEVIDFATYGRSDEWQANVLSNTALRTRVLGKLKPGTHRVRVHALDPGFILDRIEIIFDGAPKYYGSNRPFTAMLL
jgi:hypothetical protein